MKRDSCYRAGDQVLAADENSWAASCHWDPWDSCKRPCYDAEGGMMISREDCWFMEGGDNRRFVGPTGWLPRYYPVQAGGHGEGH